MSSELITTTSKITVQPIQQMGGDHMVIAAARVASTGEAALACVLQSADDKVGLIRYLMQQRHGTPFEHSAMTFYVHAPIFVWREWHRHRIGFSYNEESARYKKLEPVFYLPEYDRPMVKVDGWKPGRPKFLTLEQHFEQQHRATRAEYDPVAVKVDAAKIYERLCKNLKTSYEVAYVSYTDNLSMNIDPGLSRDCLPVGIYSSCWVTCNPRSLMAFLSLRTHEERAEKVSYPLWEIEIAAKLCEEFLESGWPITYKAFNDFGRVAP